MSYQILEDYCRILLTHVGWILWLSTRLISKNTQRTGPLAQDFQWFHWSPSCWNPWHLINECSMSEGSKEKELFAHWTSHNGFIRSYLNTISVKLVKNARKLACKCKRTRGTFPLLLKNIIPVTWSFHSGFSRLDGLLLSTFCMTYRRQAPDAWDGGAHCKGGFQFKAPLQFHSWIPSQERKPAASLIHFKWTRQLAGENEASNQSIRFPTGDFPDSNVIFGHRLTVYEHTKTHSYFHTSLTVPVWGRL